MHGYCLSQSGTFGICRYCFLKETGKTNAPSANVVGDTPAVKIRIPINKSNATPSVPKALQIPTSTPALPLSSSTPASSLPCSTPDGTTSTPENEGTTIPAPTSQHNDDEDSDDEEYFPGDEEEEDVKIYEVVLEDGILVPPNRDPKDITIDEIEEINKLGTSEKTEQLWSLACSLVQQTFDDENPGKVFKSSDRFQMYCNYMDQVMLNYPDTSHGKELLRYFNTVTGKSEWPTYLKNKWISVRQSCRQDLQKWLKQKNCPLTREEIVNMDDILKVRCYVGHVIDSSISATDAVCNNHWNKHWPTNFMSGESPTGLLQMIRRWYYDTIENHRRAVNAYKVWAGKHKSISEKYSEQQKLDDIDARMKKKHSIIDGIHHNV
jgi:hypothetical protein